MSGSLPQYWSLRDARAASPAPGATLVIQPLPGIGDMVWHLPHLHALAARAGSGVWLLTKRRAGAERLLRGDPAVAGLLWLERKPGRHDGWLGFWRLVGLLRAGRFAEVWILHDSARYAWAARLAGIPRRYGYGFTGQQALTQTRFLGRAEQRLHPLIKAYRLLELLGVGPLEDEPHLALAADAVAAVGERYGHLPQPWLALGVGSSEPYKQWGAARFAELARALPGRGIGTVLVLGGPAERRLAQDILAAAQHPAVVAVTDLPLDQSAALLARCQAYVGNDTGVLNMAAALGVPALGLFGASPPLHHSRHIHPLTPAAGAGMAAIDAAQVLVALNGLVPDLDRPQPHHKRSGACPPRSPD
ncbi:MAG TPA: glycosyltransferase family 9 protein [Candidatus Competibacteraceae bacterium]|nr:glycosyltransferase family 9 protein [Candidatus Competibacteraceae bacterium]